MEDPRLRVLTLNCWGVPFAPYRPERMTAIGRTFAFQTQPLPYDIICLQEVWMDVDYRILREAIVDAAGEKAFPYAHRFKAGVIGSGCAIMSRYPILESSFQVFNSAGTHYKVWHGDAYGGKGVGHALVDTPFGFVDVFCTHTHAQYSDSEHYEEYHGIRLAQMLQLAHVIKRCSLSSMVILAGDLNARPDSPEIRLLLSLTGMKDAYAQVKGIPPFSNQLGGVTCTTENPFNEPSSGCGSYICEDEFFGGRIDYILFLHRRRSSNAFYESSFENRDFHSTVVESCDVVFDDSNVKVSSHKQPFVPMTDHYGVDAIFRFEEEEQKGFSECEPEVIGDEFADLEFEEADEKVPFTPMRRKSEDSYLSVGANQKHKSLLDNLASSINIITLGVQDARHRRKFFQRFKWVLLLIPIVLQISLFKWLGIDSKLNQIALLCVAFICFGCFFIFFIVEHSTLPMEIAALEQARGELDVLWKRHSRMGVHRDSLVIEGVSRSYESGQNANGATFEPVGVHAV